MPRSPHLRRLGFAALATLGLLLLAEGTARLIWGPDDLVMNPVLTRFVDHPTLLWVYRPNLAIPCHERDPQPCAPSSTNSLGLRSPEVERQKSPGTFRVLSLGESSTAGSFVPVDQTYTAVAGEILNAEGHPVEVVNAGVEAWTTWQSSVFLSEDLGRELDPDLVLVYHDQNDRLPSGVIDQHNFLYKVDGTDRELIERRRAIAPALRLLYRSTLYLRLRKALLGLPQDLPAPGPARAAPGVGVRVPDEDRRLALQTLKEACETIGCQLVILQPTYQVGRMRRHNDFLESWSKKNRVPWIDLQSVWQGSGLGPQAFWVDGVHPTARAHRMLGEHIAAELMDRELVPAD